MLDESLDSTTANESFVTLLLNGDPAFALVPPQQVLVETCHEQNSSSTRETRSACDHAGMEPTATSSRSLVLSVGSGLHDPEIVAATQQIGTEMTAAASWTEFQCDELDTNLYQQPPEYFISHHLSNLSKAQSCVRICCTYIYVDL
ncbi:hypothetical protein quinque_000026, partial [Culex quinquefasciatus]